MNIPVAVLVMGSIFTYCQSRSQQDIEEQRAEAQQDVEEQRAQDEAMQSYLDQMSSLLNNGLRNSEEGSEERILARARTLEILARSGESHDRRVIAFLDDSGLILRGNWTRVRQDEETGEQVLNYSPGKEPVVRLFAADLRKADLEDRIIVAANLRGVRLNGANLTKAYLYSSALTHADLSDAILNSANLHGVDLTKANLSGADLSGADLSRANLEGATGITSEELEDQAKSLEGATMPDGSTYD